MILYAGVFHVEQQSFTRCALVAMLFFPSANSHLCNCKIDITMPQQSEYLSFCNFLVSHIDYSEAQNILELTTTKQKQLRRQRSQVLYKHILLKRTYSLVCDLLDSDCSNQNAECQPAPLSKVDTNKRKLSSDNDTIDDKIQSTVKKSKNLMDNHYNITNNNDILQFLHELNTVKVASRY